MSAPTDQQPYDDSVKFDVPGIVAVEYEFLPDDWEDSKWMYLMGSEFRRARIKNGDKKAGLGVVTVQTRKVFAPHTAGGHDNVLECRAAFCSPKDRFDRQYGREMTEQKHPFQVYVNDKWSHYEIACAVIMAVYTHLSSGTAGWPSPRRNWKKLLMEELSHHAEMELITREERAKHPRKMKKRVKV